MTLSAPRQAAGQLPPLLANTPVSLAAIAGWALVLLAAKFWAIGTYGSDVPFWDQWDGQAAYLFSPWLAGDLPLGTLFSGHNEHRIFFTRILALLLLQVNGLWSPLLEMCVNAVLHVAVVISAAVLLGRATGVRAAKAMLLGAGALIFTVPFGWENTLSGFQSQFYFVVLFSFWALWLLQAAAFSRRWWAGVLLCVCAYFSLASGAIAAAAGAVSILLRIGAGRGRRLDWVAAIVLLGLFAAGYVATPVVPAHAALHASSLWQFSDGVMSALSWPFRTDDMVLVRNAPLLALLMVMGMQRPDAGDARWYILAVGAWSVLQSLALAYGRGSGVYASRYLDLHAVALLANAAALLAVAVPALQSRHGQAALIALLAWTLSVATQLSVPVAQSPILARTLATKRDTSLRQQVNLANFLRTRDAGTWARVRAYDLPYPDTRRLARITADSRLVGILPGELQPLPRGAIPSGRLQGLVTWLLAHWQWLLITGATLVAFAVGRSLLGLRRDVAGGAALDVASADQVLRRNSAA